MFGMNETYVSPAEKAYDRFMDRVRALYGRDLTAEEESNADGMYEAGSSVEEVADELRFLAK